MPENTPEYIHVEKKRIIYQLTGMCWKYIEGDKFNPKVTERENFKQVILRNLRLVSGNLWGFGLRGWDAG